MDAKLVGDAIETLSLPGLWFADLQAGVPRSPGLYAFHVAPDALDHVDWDLATSTCLLYIGKAERSLRSRDVTTHFGTGKTGASTVRRSLAALLSDDLDLRPRPRSDTGKLYAANFALEPDGDARLSAWMREHLRLATWASPSGVDLGEIETAVLTRLQPPLNLDKVPQPSMMLTAKRRALADRVRAEFGAGRE